MMIDELKNLANTLNTNKDYIPRARRISMNLSKIEAILKTGFTLNSLVRVLNENGFEITFKSFKNDVYQARKKLKQGASQKNNISVKTDNEIQETENIEPPKRKRMTIINDGEPPKRMKTLREIEEETEREQRENKRPLY